MPEVINICHAAKMGLGVRVATPFIVKQGGSILNSAGGQNEKGTWGKTAEWIDYFGNVGTKTIGLMLVPDPANFRSSWFHSRDYGLVVANIRSECLYQG